MKGVFGEVGNGAFPLKETIAPTSVVVQMDFGQNQPTLKTPKWWSDGPKSLEIARNERIGPSTISGYPGN